MSDDAHRPVTISGAPEETHEPPRVSRRQVVAGAMLGSIGLAVSACSRAPDKAAPSNNADPVVQSSNSGRKLIRNATVVTQDPTLGTVQKADILIEGERIVAIGPDLAAGDAEVIDASEMIAIPGFVDTHRHMWQGCIRHLFPDSTLDDYFGGVLARLGPRYRPEDAHIGNLVSALSAIDAGVTTMLDWSHIQNSPEHTDAVIAALKESGLRAVFGFGAPQLGATPPQEDKSRYPADIKRLRTQYFSSDEQLLTLALAADGPSFGSVEPAIAEWHAAREVGARISVHVMGAETLPKLQVMKRMGLLKSDTTYVHCTRLPKAVWAIIAETGGTVSIASTIEMQMGHGIPAIQESLDHGIQPSLSVDVETSAPNDMFTQMRSVFSLQRALVNQRAASGEKKLPSLIGVADVLAFATLAGAKANGLDAKIGTLAPGKQADLLLLRKNRINVMPLKDAIGAVVLGMDTSNIDSVFIAGRAMKRNGQLVGVDLNAIAARSRASQEYILQGAG